MEISIQIAGLGDVPEIALLNIQLQKDEGSEPLTPSQAEMRLEKWLREKYTCYFFNHDGSRVGYVLFRPTDPDSEGHTGGYFVRQFMIVPHHRGRGMGSKAFQAFLDTVGGEAPIMLETIVSNPRAQKFWLNMGFGEYSVKFVRHTAVGKSGSET
jgi:GNAT superfamily N-acetyltransferase